MGVDLFILLNWLSKQPSFQLQQGYHLIPAYLSNKEYIYGICKPSGWGLALNFPSVVAVAGLGPWWVLSKCWLILEERQSVVGGISTGYVFFFSPPPMTFFFFINIVTMIENVENKNSIKNKNCP